jgi:LacI family transcriptional regulator
MERKKVTVYDMAKACGVGIATVSRALNGHKHVSPKTRELVFQKMKELGYQPSWSARALSTGRSRVVSVWFRILAVQYVSTFLAALEQHLAEADYEMLLCDLWNRPAGATVPAASDGIIVLGPLPWSKELLHAKFGAAVPVVSLGVYWSPEVDHVGIDLEDAFREAYFHLVECGCTRIAYAADRHRCIPTDTRFRTYLACAEQAGLEPEIINTPNTRERRVIAEAMARRLEECGCPDGLLCYDDDLAILTCHVLRERGLRIPEDVAVVGCNGSEETEYLECPVSTIVLPVAEACAAAWRFLENRMRAPGIPLQSLTLQPKLEIRASSRRVTLVRRTSKRPPLQAKAPSGQ